MREGDRPCDASFILKALVAVALTVLPAALGGCAAGVIGIAVAIAAGGGGGGGGADTTQPDLLIAPITVEPTPHLSGNSAVTITGTIIVDLVNQGGGPGKLKINKKPVTVAQDGTWSHPLTLAPGINMLKAKVKVKGMRPVKVAWAYLYSAAFLPPNQPINNAVVAQIDDAALPLLPQPLADLLFNQGGTRTDDYGETKLTVVHQIGQAPSPPGTTRTIGTTNFTSPPPPPSDPLPAPGSATRGNFPPPMPPDPSPDFVLSISENLVNRVLFTAWQSRQLTLRVDEAFLAAHGITLPFPLDTSVLVPFLPSLASVYPPNAPAPIAIDLEPRLPPVVRVADGPSPLELSLGEVDVTIVANPGGGQERDVLTLSMQALLPCEVTVANDGDLAISFGKPQLIGGDALAGMPALTQGEVDRFVNKTLPKFLKASVPLLTPIPLPVVQGLHLTNIDIFQDGPGGDFLTIEGDL